MRVDLDDDRDRRPGRERVRLVGEVDRDVSLHVGVVDLGRHARAPCDFVETVLRTVRAALDLTLAPGLTPQPSIPDGPARKSCSRLPSSASPDTHKPGSRSPPAPPRACAAPRDGRVAICLGGGVARAVPGVWNASLEWLADHLESTTPGPRPARGALPDTQLAGSAPVHRGRRGGARGGGVLRHAQRDACRLLDGRLGRGQRGRASPRRPGDRSRPVAARARLSGAFF